MFAVTVTFEVAPGRMAEFLPLMLENARASLGEAACTRFDVLTDPSRPDEVFLYELYDDEAGFETHKGTEHFKTFNARSDGMVTDKTLKTFAQVAG